jgi:hypothetical protein
MISMSDKVARSNRRLHAIRGVVAIVTARVVIIRFQIFMSSLGSSTGRISLAAGSIGHSSARHRVRRWNHLRCSA